MVPVTKVNGTKGSLPLLVCAVQRPSAVTLAVCELGNPAPLNSCRLSSSLPFARGVTGTSKCCSAPAATRPQLQSLVSRWHLRTQKAREPPRAIPPPALAAFTPSSAPPSRSESGVLCEATITKGLTGALPSDDGASARACPLVPVYPRTAAASPRLPVCRRILRSEHLRGQVPAEVRRIEGEALPRR